MKNFKIFSLISLVSVTCFLAAGCVQLQRQYPDVKTYSLDMSSQKHMDYSGPEVSLRLNAFSAVPQAADRYLAYRTQETAYEADFYNQFMTAPAEMIRDQAAIWLKGSPLVQYILKAGETANPFFVVDGVVLDLYGDYRRSSAPKAVLRLKLTVSDSGAGRVVFQKIYLQEVSLDRISPVVLTEGWNKGLGLIFEDFERDLKELLSEEV